VVVITGGGTGIGFMIATALVVNGAKGTDLEEKGFNLVIITGRRQNTLDNAVGKLDKIQLGRATG
jgi:short-subunit dehydrogenase involved in D-alanine esterification of teichoic acids